MQSMTDRPWLRRDTYFAETGEGLQLANGSSGFEIQGSSAYQLFKMIHPFLNGGITQEELRAATGERWPVVEKMLAPLTQHGFLRWIPDADVDLMSQTQREQHADQLAFLAQFVDDPHRSFLRFAQARVLVVGTTALAEAVLVNLVNNGAQHVASTHAHSSTTSLTVLDQNRLAYDDYDVVVVDQQSLDAIETPEVADHPGLEIIYVHGDELRALPVPWSGRHTDASRTWGDAVDSLARVETHGDTLSRSKALRYLRGPESNLGARVEAEPVQRMLGALLAYEIFKGLTQCLQPHTARGILTLNSLTGETDVHPVPKSPGWGELTKPIEEPIEDRGESLDASRADDYDDYWASLVDPITLPARSFQDLDLEQVPVRVSAVETNSGLERAASLWTTADARIEALARVYEEHLQGTHPDHDQVRLGVGETVERAASRAARNVACAVALDSLRSDGHSIGRFCELTSTSRAARFIQESAPELRHLDLGEYDGVHVGVAYEPAADTGGPARWALEAAGDLHTALVRAGTAVLGARQMGFSQGEVDPRHFLGQEEPQQGTIRLHERSEAMAESLGLVVVEGRWRPTSR